MSETDNQPQLDPATCVKNNFGCQFAVQIKMHTIDGFNVLESPARIRDIIGAALEQLEQGKVLQEEIDFTLEVKRVY